MRGCGIAAMAAAVLGLASGAAAAAPQVLALVGTGGPVALACEGADCAADFSAFCLQPDRRSPDPGERYRLADGSAVRLIGVRPDGGEVELPAGELLAVHALRTHVAVRISVDAGKLAERGLAGARLEVGERVSLLPEGSRADPAPQPAHALREATGPLRRIGEGIVDRDPVRMAAARLTLGAINALPRAVRAPAASQPATLPAADGAPPQAVELAQEGLDRCRADLARGVAHDLRACLETTHDILVGELNNAYWAALKTGS